MLIMKQFVSMTNCLCVRFFVLLECASPLLLGDISFAFIQMHLYSNDYFVSCLANNNTILYEQTFVVILFIYTRQLFTFSVLQIYFCLIVYCLYRIMIQSCTTNMLERRGRDGEGVWVEVGCWG